MQGTHGPIDQGKPGQMSGYETVVFCVQCQTHMEKQCVCGGGGGRHGGTGWPLVWCLFGGGGVGGELEQKVK